MRSLFLSFVLFLSTFGVAEEPPVESVVVLGGGVGGLSSALYLGRAGFSPLVIQGNLPGGLLTQTHSVQNWPGEMEIEGGALIEKIESQAQKSGARIMDGEVVAVDFSKRPLRIDVKRVGESEVKSIFANAALIAMGTTPHFLRVQGESTYWGKGVSNCALCDGSLYRDRVVGVVGGGDAAVLEASYLSQIAKKVYVFVRKEKFKAHEVQRLEAMLQLPNVEVLYQTEVGEILGNEEGLTGVLLKNGGRKIDLDGLFLAIGSSPNTKMFVSQLELDEKGYIVLTQGFETSVPGVYAVGDIVDPEFKQAISAAGDGAKAAIQVERTLGLYRREPEVKKASLVRKEVVEVMSADEFDAALKEAEGTIVVDFYASWCGPCKRIAPLLTSSAETLSGKVTFLKVNVDLCPDLSRRYQIRAMPTCLVLDSEGKELMRKVGAEEITSLLMDLREKRVD